MRTGCVVCANHFIKLKWLTEFLTQEKVNLNFGSRRQQKFLIHQDSKLERRILDRSLITLYNKGLLRKVLKRWFQYRLRLEKAKHLKVNFLWHWQTVSYFNGPRLSELSNEQKPDIICTQELGQNFLHNKMIEDSCYGGLGISKSSSKANETIIWFIKFNLLEV